MGNEYCNQSKPHYDITLSKRTRKPLNLAKGADQSLQKTRSPERKSSTKGVNNEEEKPSNGGGEENGHKSLKQLIEHRSPLGQHFINTEEEKQLQLVVKQKKREEEDLDRVKCKRMVSRYARVLTRLIKVERDPRVGSRKKPVVRLTI